MLETFQLPTTQLVWQNLFVRGCMCCGGLRRNDLPLLPCPACQGGYCGVQCQRDDFFRHRRDCNSCPAPPGLRPVPPSSGLVHPPLGAARFGRGPKFSPKGGKKQSPPTPPRLEYCTGCYRHLSYCPEKVECSDCHQHHRCSPYCSPSSCPLKYKFPL